MAEYIKREDVLNKLLHTDSVYGAYMSIAKIKPADVVERKKGKWITEDGKPLPYGVCFSVCSECGHSSPASGFSFCPSCGADMRKLPKEE